MLPKKQLGQTDLELSILGLGTVKLGRNEKVKYPQGFELPSDKEASKLLHTAFDLGINLLDTAPAYGNSEQRLGKLLRGQRQQWYLCTKVGEEFVNGSSHFDFSPEHTRASIERSLRRLNTDYLDIALIHSDGNDQVIIEGKGTLETLADLKKEGKIRAFGMSSKTLEGGILAAGKSDCAMVTLNIHQNEELEVIDYCHQHNKGVLIKKALASGHATENGEENLLEKSFQLIFSHPGVNSAIVGTINLQHLKNNVSYALEAITPKI